MDTGALSSLSVLLSLWDSIGEGGERHCRSFSRKQPWETVHVYHEAPRVAELRHKAHVRQCGRRPKAERTGLRRQQGLACLESLLVCPRRPLHDCGLIEPEPAQPVEHLQILDWMDVAGDSERYSSYPGTCPRLGREEGWQRMGLFQP